MSKNSQSRARSRAFAQQRATARAAAAQAAREAEALRLRQEKSWQALAACLGVVAEAKVLRRALRRRAVESYNSTIMCGADHGDFVSVTQGRRWTARLEDALEGGEFAVR